MNQLTSKFPILKAENAFLCSIYWIEEETLFTFSAMLIAFTNTVAAAVPRRFMAVPIRVWSALKLIADTASRRE